MPLPDLQWTVNTDSKATWTASTDCLAQSAAKYTGMYCTSLCAELVVDLIWPVLPEILIYWRRNYFVQTSWRVHSTTCTLIYYLIFLLLLFPGYKSFHVWHSANFEYHTSPESSVSFSGRESQHCTYVRTIFRHCFEPATKLQFFSGKAVYGCHGYVGIHWQSM